MPRVMCAVMLEHASSTVPESIECQSVERKSCFSRGPVCQVVPPDRAGCLGISVHRDSEVNPENCMVRVADRGLDSNVDRGFEVREH